MNTPKPARPLHPFRVGDRVKVRGTRKYAIVTALLPANACPLVRYKNGNTEQISAALLDFNYGKRGTK